MKRKDLSVSLTPTKSEEKLIVTEIPAGTSFWRGISHPVPFPCHLKQDEIRWFSANKDTAKNYAKPQLCEYIASSPFKTLNASQENLDLLMKMIKEQVKQESHFPSEQGKKAKSLLNELTLAFGYDPRTHKSITCSDLLSLSQEMKFPLSKRTKVQLEENPERTVGRCSYSSHDSKVMQNICSLLGRFVPVVQGYSEGKLPSLAHGGFFHNETMLCHPSKVLEPRIRITIYDIFLRVKQDIWISSTTTAKKVITDWNVEHAKDVAQIKQSHPDAVLVYSYKKVYPWTRLFDLPEICDGALFRLVHQPTADTKLEIPIKIVLPDKDKSEIALNFPIHATPKNLYQAILGSISSPPDPSLMKPVFALIQDGFYFPLNMDTSLLQQNLRATATLYLQYFPISAQVKFAYIS
jgi:hypothetical protein